MRTIRGTLNRVELIGYLGNDPEHRQLASGVAICHFNLATKRYGAREDNGQRPIETEWTSIEAWEKLAEQCRASLHKGSRVLVSGTLRNQSWEDKDTGQRRWRTVVRAEQIIFLDPRATDSGDDEEE